MKKTAFVLALGALLSGTTQAAEPEALTVERLNTLNKIHSVALSPDGSLVVYGVKNPEGSDLYLLDLAKPAEPARQLTSHKGSESSVAWSKDGGSVYFLAKRGENRQIWRLSLSGGEAVAVTNLPVDIDGFKLSPDEKHLALAIDVAPGCETLQCTLDKRALKAKVKTTAMAYDQLMVRHWDTWEDEYNTHLFVAALGDKPVGNAKDLMPSWKSDIAGMAEVTFTPDSKALVFSAKAPGRDHAWTTNFDLFQIAVAGGEPENLTKDNPAWDAKPVFSGDGRYMAYLAMKTPGYESDKFAIMLKDLRTGQLKELAPQFDRSVSDMAFGAGDRALYVTAQDLGQKSIFEISTNFGDVRTVYSDGTAGNLQVVNDTLVFSRHALNAPADLYTIRRDGTDLKQLTEVNKEAMAELRLGEFEQFSFPGWNDETVYGYVVKPWNYQPGKKYPVAFLVHGGPQGSFGNMFHYRWNAQLWAAQGYGVVMVDFHGSTGYGQAFTDSIARDWGGKPLEDLKKGLAFATGRYMWLDGDNACALGASYGGFMMNWISGNWNTGFKCLVNHAGLFDMKAFYESTEELWFAEHDMGGAFWDKDTDYSKFNPSDFVDNWQIPTLVIQGLKDYRVPYAQSLGAFTTLQRKGIDSRLVIYPDENHHILNPDNLVNWYQEVFAWMGKHLEPAK